jgi:hypothetical protein
MLRATQRRAVTPLLATLPGHLTGITAVGTGSLLASPVGTVALVGAAYQVGYVGLKYAWFQMEMVSRDYLQDYVLAQQMRYIFLISMLLGFEGLFIEA